MDLDVNKQKSTLYVEAFKQSLSFLKQQFLIKFDTILLLLISNYLPWKDHSSSGFIWLK